jgi:tRNA A37 threonylcarbamoyladenosine synthetase subunit TsaC/SUA5/YrdC
MLKNNPKLRIGSLLNPVDLADSVQIIKQGGVVVAELGGVIGMFADGTNVQALNKILTAKQIPDKNRPFSAMIFYTDVIRYIDLSLIHPELKSLLSKPEGMAELVGTLIHLRIPLRNDLIREIPLSMRNQSGNNWIMHALDPTGRPMENFTRNLNSSGINFLAVTTLNKHGEPEITNWNEAITFSQTFARSTYAVSLHLTDPTYKRKSVKGSLTIVDTMQKTIAREGFVPTELVEAIFGMSFNKTKAKQVKYRQAPGFIHLKQHLTNNQVLPADVRKIILGYITGKVRFERKNGFLPVFH